MPHLILEYSDNLATPLDHQALLAELHAALEQFGLFRLAEIKSRAIAYRHYRIGDGRQDRVFVHLSIALLSGRDLTVRQQISAALLSILRRFITRTWEERPCDVTVDVREMQRETYGKAMNAAAGAIADETP